jgi:ribosome maturation protein SDO1
MTDTVAKIRKGSKHFEVVVDEELALKVKKGEEDNVSSALLMNEIFHNSKSGEKAGKSELEEAFGTTDLLEVAEKIIKKGEIEVSQSHRDEEREQKKKKVIDWYARNAVDAKTGRPFTPEILSSALDQAGVNIDNKPIEQQITGISEKLSKIIPLKIETKKLIITIPAVHTGKAYGIVNEYKEKEDWLSNGDLKITVNIPVGLQSEFYDKLNGVTHGAAITEEVKQESEEN